MDKDDLHSTEGHIGLRTLSEPEDALADIVFVHGLTGNRESTWTHKTTKTFWPQKLLPNDLPNVRIVTFGYDSDIVRALDTAGSNTLRDHGKSLANDVAMWRSRSDSNRRPLIFVAHSLGGLVVEQALLISRGAAQQYIKDVLESTKGIVFMGTPHMGSNKANWLALLTNFTRVLRTTNSQIVSVLEPGSQMLANLQQEFHTMLDDRARNHKSTMEIFCYFEEVPVDVVGMIVPSHSAILAAYLNQSIHANHIGMTKFSGAKDPGYISVRNLLWLWIKTLQGVQSNPSRVQEAQPEPLKIREKRIQHFGPANSNGGPILQGDNSAGGDMNIGTYPSGRK